MINYDKGTILLDFYANWCGQCKMLMPRVELATKNHKDLVIYKIDVDKEQDLVSKFNITNLPTFILLKDGEVIKRGGAEVLETL